MYPGPGAEAAAALDGVQVVGVREADFVDLFVERRERMPGVELLLRANRVLGKGDTDKLDMRNGPGQGKRVVKRLSARVTAGKQATKERPPPGHGRIA